MKGDEMSGTCNLDVRKEKYCQHFGGKNSKVIQIHRRRWESDFN
jgi:hypothetical protein